MYDDNAPMFFSEGILGISTSGPNAIVSFAVDVPNIENTVRTKRVNLRIVIPIASLEQNIEFLTRALKHPEDLQGRPSVQ